MNANRIISTTTALRSSGFGVRSSEPETQNVVRLKICVNPFDPRHPCSMRLLELKKRLVSDEILNPNPLPQDNLYPDKSQGHFFDGYSYVSVTHPIPT